MTAPSGRPHRGAGPRRHRGAVALVLLVLLLAVACAEVSGPQEPVLPATGSVPAEAGPAGAPASRPPAAQPPPSGAAPPRVEPGPGASLLARGEDLYGAGCASCHGQRGEGSWRGPALVDVGAASVDFQLATGRMPLSEEADQPLPGPPRYPAQDIDALVAYVAGLGGRSGPPVPTLGRGDAAAGRSPYLATCAACHGSTGVGAALPDGHVAPSVLGSDPVQVAEAVRVGPGMMPQFPESVLSDDELEDVVAYVGALRERGDHGGWTIGSVGPVTEGAVAWLLGLGVLVVVIRLLGKRAGQ